MDLERIAVQLRPRNGWESVDLGLALARHWWRPIYGRWLALTGPAAVLLVALAGGYGLLLFWWLLPIFEVAVLFTVSRAVFGATPTGRATLKALPGLWRKGLPELLVRRLHPARALYLSVGQLEGLQGKERRQRCGALADGQNVSIMLVAIFAMFELGLAMALLGLVTVIIPTSLGVDWGLLTERLFDGTLPRVASVAGWLLMAACVMALHPLYITSGFALYLNRRTKLEGWDLEIAFRRLAKRAQDLNIPTPESSQQPTSTPPDDHGAPTKSVTAVAMVLAVTLAGLQLTTPELAAAEQTTEDVTTEEATEEASVPAEVTTPRVEPASWHGDPEHDPRRLIAEVLARPEFQNQETVVRWRLRKDLLEGFDEDDNDSSPNPALVWLAQVIASFGEPLLWLVAAGVLLLLLRAMWRYLRLDSAPTRRPSQPTVEHIAGLDVRPESLPQDIPGSAARLWHDGQPAAALSLLYRGAVARLVDEGLELRESFTEDDCLRSARVDLEPNRLDVFADLTRAWQRVAYAHRIPEASDAQRLWSVWGEHFGGAS